MRPYACGCAAEGEGDYCDTHLDWSCHGGPAQGSAECPPCRRRRWLGVASHHNPTKTRRLSRETAGLEGMR